MSLCFPFRIQRSHRFALPVVSALALAMLMPTIANARVRLTTLPVRERVEIQLDHPTVTLVEEERIVPLVQGSNQIDFTWANTQIDPGTIVFRVLGPAGDQEWAQAPSFNIISVSYPPNENALVWDVSASNSAAVRVRISYVMGGLERSFNYRATASNDESTLSLAQYIRVHNLAAEQFGQTSIFTGYGERIDRALGSNETREMLVARYDDVPIEKTYTCNPAQYGYLDRARNRLNVPMHYVLTNDEEHGLGAEPLPYGKVRIFQRDSQGTTAFTGEDWGAFTPLDDEMRLFLGTAQDVIVERVVLEIERTRIAGNLYNHDVIVRYEIQNTKDTPVTLNIAETIAQVRGEAGLPNHRDNRPVQWTVGDRTTASLAEGLDDEETNLEQVQVRLDLPARDGDETETVTVDLHLVFHNEF